MMSDRIYKEEKEPYRRFYVSSLLLVVAASVYPIYMGMKIFLLYLAEGMISVEQYPKYIIPYTPMCIGLIFVTAVYPLLYRKWKQKVLPLASGLGILIFWAIEWAFEQIPVVEGYKTVPLDAWQLSLCIATPEVLQAIGEPIYAENNPAYKVHFYLIVMLIMLAVIRLIHGYTHMIREKDTAQKRSLLAQAVCVTLFIGFCILACFTAFFRNGTIYISPLSSVLTGGFFVLFGVTAGVYGATLMCAPAQATFGDEMSGKSAAGKDSATGKGKGRTWLPSVIAMLTTTAMYVGELVLMGGELFRFGKGIFFEPLGVLPFSGCDLLIIAAAGGVTRMIGKWMRK